jgi:hypothetical protein
VQVVDKVGVPKDADLNQVAFSGLFSLKRLIQIRRVLYIAAKSYNPPTWGQP